MNKRKIKYLILTSAARHGKDSFAALLKEISINKYDFEKYAFADMLKSDLNPLCFDMFGKFVTELDSKQKEIFRKVLIAYGCAWREVDPLHWVKIVDDNINNWEITFPSQSNIYIISDGRFSNELKYFKDKYGDQVFVLELIRENGPEPTDEEKKNIPLLRNLIDKSITIGDFSGQDYLEKIKPIVSEFYNTYF